MKKIIFVTGASSGIGKALSIKFANRGWKVLASARRLDLLKKLDKESINSNAIIPIRLNRSLVSIICTFILRTLLSIISLKKIGDFNGQPKILRRSMIKNINDLPSDFCIDFAIYRIFEDNFKSFPIIQKKREYGSSSWNKDFLKWAKIFLRYLSYAIFFSKRLHK